MRVAVILLFIAGWCHAGSRFVSLVGHDTNPGTQDQPWQTIQQAVDRLTPGDTLYVREGKYPEQIRVKVSGIPEEKITLRNYEQERVTLAGGSIFVNNQSHLCIQGFHITNTRGEKAAIEVTGNGGFVDIVGNEIHGLRSRGTAALRVGGSMHHFSINGNHVHHNDTGNQEAIRVHESTRDFTVINNHVSDNSNIGIDIVGWAQFGKPTRGLIARNRVYNNATNAPWAAGIYLDGPDNMVVEHNISSGHYFGYKLGCEPPDDTSKGHIFRYNIAYNNTEYGLGIGGWTGGEVHHCQVYNNVFANNHREIGFSKNPGHHHQVINNILYNPTGQSINYLRQKPADTTIDYNCYFTQYGDTPGANSIRTDPLFTDVSNARFNLQRNSPCLSAGMTLKEQPNAATTANIGLP